ncbi:unnamed protein product [Schistosoma mattheei]|uniref:Coenzyme Q-binding protein COQ10 START domain-containing protein n=1 Tax=Schistosoma mattheei TaxID=31246 RepID=A0AA85BDL8_9TREM|nr:unnamed protein product [Schistosoma mattheei]
MFDIAIDVGRYSEFIPWCNQSTVLEQGENNMLACLGVGFPPLSESYMSRITFQRPKHLKSVAQNAGMFHHLINEWHFHPGLPENPNSCFVEFSVDFEFRSPIYSKIAGLFFDQVVTVMVNAFMDRAKMSMNSNLCVVTQKIGRFLLIGLNRPEKGNLINQTTASMLNDILYNQFDKDDNIIGGVLYGEGKDFCLGLDMEELTDYIKQNPTCDNTSLNRLYSCLSIDSTKLTFSKPLIAAIAGKAIGAGLELTLACDLRVAEIDSILSLHKRKHCIPMMNMGTIRLPGLIGLSRSLDMILTGRELHANEALEFGLVNRVTPTGTAIGVSVKMIDAIYRLPGLSALYADRSNVIRASQYSMNSELAKMEYNEALNAFKNEGINVINEKLSDQPTTERECNGK